MQTPDGKNNEIRVLKRDDGTVVGNFGPTRYDRRIAGVGGNH